MVCNPSFGPCGKVFNIISTILGIVTALIIPITVLAVTGVFFF